mmetsp:Transcript_67842/g.220882  ORF Transcript_67842/g.220882 Transcript_67842/m.220882 type:complete len:597 (+) Transcript_67842:1230-3020(+)
MRPTLKAVAIDLRPHVVGPIVDMPRLVAQSSSDEREAIRPLATATRSPLQQLAWVIVPREASLQATQLALGNLHSASPEKLLLLIGLRRSDCLCLSRAAMVALRAVGPREEKLLVPQQNLLHEHDLVSLGRGWPLLPRERVQGGDRDLVQGLFLQPAFVVLLCTVEAADLLLQPPREAAQLGLQHRQVLLLDHLRLRVRCRRVHAPKLKRVRLGGIADHHDGGRLVRGLAGKQHVATHGDFDVVGRGHDPHQSGVDGRLERHPEVLLGEDLEPLELRAAVGGQPRPTFGLGTTHLEPSHEMPIRWVARQDDAGDVAGLSEVQLVPRGLVVRLRVPRNVRVHPGPVVRPGVLILEYAGSLPVAVRDVRDPERGASLRSKPTGQRPRQGHRLVEGAAGHTEAKEPLLLLGHLGNREDLHAQQFPAFVRLALHLMRGTLVVHQNADWVRRKRADILGVDRAGQRRREGRRHRLGPRAGVQEGAGAGDEDQRGDAADLEGAVEGLLPHPIAERNSIPRHCAKVAPEGLLIPVARYEDNLERLALVLAPLVHLPQLRRVGLARATPMRRKVQSDDSNSCQSGGRDLARRMQQLRPQKPLHG